MRGLFVARLQQFIAPIIAQLEKHGIEATLISDFDRTTAPVSDFIWVDFADQNAFLVQEFLTRAKKILRIHRYELYTEQISSIIPAEWDSIIFVNEHHRQLFEIIHGKCDNLYVIANYLDLSKYAIPEKKKVNNKIAVAGFISRKKGIGELVLLAQMLPDYEFHVCGTFHEQDVYGYLEKHQPSNMFLYPWTNDLPEFFSDKTYYLSTSISESFCVSMVEAMLCGLRPLCRNWLGAENVYDENDIWSSPLDLVEMLGVPHPGFNYYRERAIQKNGLEEVMDNFLEIINTPVFAPVLPTLTIAIVQTREKYLNALLNSLSLQDYPFKVDILRNFDRDKTIGQCFNELADRCDTEWIAYIGDDDVLSEDYIDSVMCAWINRMNKYRKVAGIITGSTTFDETGKKLVAIAHPTGFWKAEFVKSVRFDESLVRQVDTEFFTRVSSLSDYTILKFDWIVGYYYRQHSSNVSGNKFTEGVNRSQDPVKD